MRGRPQLRRRRADRRLIDLHSTLVRERQLLRSDGATETELEQNRLAIVTCQWALSRALIERYLPPPVTTAA
jgi:hypothetical protein